MASSPAQRASGNRWQRTRPRPSISQRFTPCTRLLRDRLRVLLLMTELAVAVDRRTVLGFVFVVVATHASRRVDVHFVVRIRAEAHLHRGKYVASIGVLERRRRTIDCLLIDRTAVRRVEVFEALRDSLHRGILAWVGCGEEAHTFPPHKGELAAH